jgi:Ohr subfamily peroxiredoxin
MNTLEKVLYTAKAHTTGGRDGGASCTDDGRLQITLTQPGTPGSGTNPEQLFGSAWSACFLSAVKLVAGKKRIAIPSDVAIDAEIDLGLVHGVHHLAARLNVNLPGMDQETAQSLVEAGSHVCPYSLATSGNIDAKYNVTTSQAADYVREAQHA